MYKITIEKGHIKKLTSLLSNKLSCTYNILSTGIVIKEVDLEKVLNIFRKTSVKNNL